jgi:catechol 2,3-dioxygenase
MVTPTNEQRSLPGYGIAAPGFRLPAGSHIGAVRLQVSDLARSIDYYEQVLGFDIKSHTADAATLGPRHDVALLSLHTRSGLVPARRGAYGLYHFAVLLPDRAALGRFAAHLSNAGLRAGMADHLVSEALYLSDPDGLGIEVYADRPRSAWRYRDRASATKLEERSRELMMTTDPLDISSVIAAGGGRPWDGAPAGTAIGHVHLHVGSLAEAEAFYHAALGLDKMAWSYPGALFLSAGGYHHHLGTNVWSAGPVARDDESRLLEWELIVPDADAVAAAAQSVRAAGYSVGEDGIGWTAADRWGTRLRLLAAVDAIRHDAMPIAQQD